MLPKNLFLAAGLCLLVNSPDKKRINAIAGIGQKASAFEILVAAAPTLEVE